MSFSEWQEVTLAEISKGGKGNYGIAASAVEYSEDLLTYLRITDIDDDGTLNKEGLKSVDDKNAEKYLLKPNDIVFARTGNSTGRSYFYDGNEGKLVFAGFLIKFSLDPEKVNPKFMRYYTLSNDYRNWISSFSTGSTRKNINAKTYAGMKINLPPRKQQDYLVNILSTLDEKIEINNQINKNLEEMAQAIFKHWFVDFEFPNNEGKPYKSSGGEMVESELGLIPKRWEVKTLGDVLLTLEAGNRPKGGAGNLTEGIPSIGAENIIGLGQYDYSKEKYVTEEYFNKMKKGIVNSGDVMLYKDGAQLGRKTMFMDGFPHKKCCINSHVFILRTNDIISQLFLYFWLDQEWMTKNIINLNANSAQPGINQSKVKSLKILVPNSENITLFDKTVMKLMKNLFKNCNENNTLSIVRDTLLPKLMSGEIRVPLESESDAS